jgi:hypothetical protein
LIAAAKLLDPSKTLTLLKDVGEVAATGSTTALYEWVWLLRVSLLFNPLLLASSKIAPTAPSFTDAGRLHESVLPFAVVCFD